MKQWDVFLSHASEDKAAVVLPLTEKLRGAGVRVWLDQQQIDLGDSVRQKIDRGLIDSRFGVVIVSDAYIGKQWTSAELDALFASHETVIPVLHGIDRDKLKKYSLLLAGKLGLSTAEGIDVVARKIAARVFSPRDDSNEEKVSSDVAHELAVLLSKPAEAGELAGFFRMHAGILKHALGRQMDSVDLFRSSVQLGPHVVDFCAATYQPSIDRMSDYVLVLFGPVTTPLFDEAGQIDAELQKAIDRAKGITRWLQTNERSMASALIKIAAGRRPQPGSAAARGLAELNDDLPRMQVRTYDWLLDSALATKEDDPDD